MEDNRLPRKKAIPVSDALQMFLKQSHLSSGLNTQRIFGAWDKASGAAGYTIRRFFRDGTLYITLNSSVARSQLSMQKDALIEKMNGILLNDDLFVRDDPNVGLVKTLVLK